MSRQDTDHGAGAANRHTVAGFAEPRDLPTVAEAFAAVFPVLAEIHRSFRRPGVLLAGVRDGRFLESHLFLDLGAGPAHALIGRHQRCDMYLGHDHNLSLRHALLRATLLGDRDVRLRLLDLCSGVGFFTEDGVPCESLVAEGPLFVRAGRYHLLFLPTGDLAAVPWSDTAADTWHSFPDRIYLDRRVPERLPRQAAKVEPGTSSRLTHIVPAVRSLRLPEAGRPGVVIGAVTLRSRHHAVAHPVTDEDVELGLLVGRYERCQLGGAERSLSRLHLLVIRDEDGLWAIDTASTNGTTLDGNGVRAVRFDQQRQLVLGGSMTLEWAPGTRPQA